MWLYIYLDTLVETFQEREREREKVILVHPFAIGSLSSVNGFAVYLEGVAPASQRESWRGLAKDKRAALSLEH